jgi:PAS domain S-box-containing protein
MISANAALPGFYDYPEVARSVLIAVAASYAGLDLAGRVTAASGRVRLAWLSGGAVAMGVGIWAMHLKGMLAFHLPVLVEYHWPTVLAALLIAILASAVALYVTSRQKMGGVQALTGSIVMSAGIAGLHYMLVAAMRVPAITQYSAFLVTCSILLAILFSLIALLLAFGLREETRWSVPRRLGSAMVMGAAISAMHYSGMAAAGFVPSSAPDLRHTVSITPLGSSGVVIATLIVLATAIVTSSVDRRAGAEIQRLNQDLERRVAERTLQIETVNQSLRKEIVERQRVEGELRQSEDRLRLVIDTIPQQIWSGPLDGSLDFCNLQWRSYMGLSLEELQGEGWQRMLHPEDRERVLKAWHESVTTCVPYEQEERHRGANGQYRWFLARGLPQRDSEEHIVRWYGTNTDIEDRKRAEDELRKQKEIFQKIFENIPVMIAFFGADGHIELVNPEWERMIGWTLQEIHKQNRDIFVELYPDPQYRQMAQNYAAAPTSGPAEFKVRARDGRVIDMAAYVVHLSDGSRLDIGRDITERKRAEAELRESEARFRLAADNAPVMIWMSGTDKLCTYFNKPWLDFSGRSIDRELGNGWAEGVDPEDLRRSLDTYTQSFDRREAFRMEYRLRRHDGEFRWVSDIGVPRFNPDGSFAGYIGSCIDVTEQRRAEEQLRQAQEDLARVTRVVAMGELAAAIAHEVNQPLGAIVINANFCLRQFANATPRLREAISDIVNDASRASAVISRIRALLRKGPSERVAVDINQIIQEVTLLLRRELTRNDVSLRTDLGHDLPPVSGDRIQLQQVVINLVTNAIEAMRLPGHRRRELVIKSAMKLDEVLIRVEDSGKGLDPQQSQHIFEPFFTTKPEGLGMGLSISLSIIESHGGRLWAERRPKGAVFQFVLPAQ